MSTVERFENRFKTDRKMDFGPGHGQGHVRVIEGEKERSQIFQGIVTNIRAGIRQSFTVRKVSAAGRREDVSRSIPRRGQDRSGAEGEGPQAKLFYCEAGEQGGESRRAREAEPETA